jgi:NHLM bacteriocin system secretion protein
MSAVYARREGDDMANNSLFRKVALDRLASPEQLDQLLKVTDPRGWVALAGLGVILGTAIVWGVLGRVPQNVTGMGILIRSGGVFEVVPLSGGRVIDVAVTAGDVVREGQVVARLDQPDLVDRLQQAKAALANLRQQHTRLVAYGEQDIALQTTYWGQQRRTLDQSIASAEKNAAWYAERVTIQERLVKDGLLLKQSLLTTQQQHDTARERITDARSKLTQLSVQELELRNRTREQARASELKIEEQAQTVDEIERELKAQGEIRAPHTGRILEVMTEPGAVVGVGQPILTLDLTGRMVKDLEAIIYVPSVHGKQIRVGMPVLIAPTTVKREEYGMMLAKVTYVSDFPATARGMHRMLKNEKLVSGLAGSDAPYEIHADLLVNPATASQYWWSSSQGPPLKIQSGTLATADITVAAKRPIELVIPLIRQYTGL